MNPGEPVEGFFVVTAYGVNPVRPLEGVDSCEIVV